MDGTRVVKLIQENITRGNYGQEIVSETYTNVYGMLQGITRSEWGTAGQRGIEASFRVDVYTFEYHGEKIVEIDGVRYAVYRTYINIGNDRTELYLETRQGVTFGYDEIEEEDVQVYVDFYETLLGSGIPVFYSYASEGQTLPYITYELDSSNFDADDIVYSKGYVATIQLHTARKSLKCERLLEGALEAANIPWERTETEDFAEREIIESYSAEII